MKTKIDSSALKDIKRFVFEKAQLESLKSILFSGLSNFTALSLSPVLWGHLVFQLINCYFNRTGKEIITDT